MYVILSILIVYLYNVCYIVNDCTACPQKKIKKGLGRSG